MIRLCRVKRSLVQYNGNFSEISVEFWIFKKEADGNLPALPHEVFLIVRVLLVFSGVVADYYRLIQRVRDNAPDNERDLELTRQTASKYLDELVDHNLLEKLRIGNSNYYINHQLVDLFINQADLYK
ncbi:MAG: hypothetical protein K6B73_07585 [Treponema sp.]|nr:hypothetical protein [Treponema sp.]